MLTREGILEAAEDVLRRYGPAKANVVDVARALGVSHGSVYRHFPSKVALRDAVAERWLADKFAPLAEIAAEDGPALERLHRWLRRLMEIKRAKVLDDPELFATYHAIALQASAVVQAHIETLVGQVAAIVADGVRRGELASDDPRATAHAIFDATARFHDPKHAAEWSAPGMDEAFEAVWALLAQAIARPASSAHSSAAR